MIGKLATKRAVVNINGTENKPSNLWEFSSYEEKRWRFHYSKYDKSYKLQIPVIVSDKSNSIIIFCPRPMKEKSVVTVKQIRSERLCEEIEPKYQEIRMAIQ